MVATDDALDIGIHPISPLSEITPADTFSNHPHLHSKPLHRPLSLPRSTILSKRLTRAHHRGRHLSGLFDQKIPNTARIPDKYAPQFVDFQQMCSNMGEARHQICPDLILHVDSPWTLNMARCAHQISKAACEPSELVWPPSPDTMVRDCLRRVQTR